MAYRIILHKKHLQFYQSVRQSVHAALLHRSLVTNSFILRAWNISIGYQETYYVPPQNVDKHVCHSFRCIWIKVQIKMSDIFDISTRPKKSYPTILVTWPLRMKGILSLKLGRPWFYTRVDQNKMTRNLWKLTYNSIRVKEIKIYRSWLL